MKKALCLLAALVLVVGCEDQCSDSLEGTWSGLVTVTGAEADGEFQLNLSIDEDNRPWQITAGPNIENASIDGPADLGDLVDVPGGLNPATVTGLIQRDRDDDLVGDLSTSYTSGQDTITSNWAILGSMDDDDEMSLAIRVAWSSTDGTTGSYNVSGVLVRQ